MTPKRYEEIPVTTLASGYRLALPVHRIEGAESGPTLGMIALIHGDEPLPNAVLREVYAQIEPAALKGNVLIMPVANPLAYEALTRNTPQDMINMNRIFPGKAGGWLTEQIAHVITTDFVPQIDYLLDFHSGGTFPTVDYVYLSKLEPEFSLAFGSDILYEGPGYEGTLSNVTEGQEGVPTAVIELGGGGLTDDHYIARGIEGALNALKYLGMIEGEPRVPTEQTVVKELAVIRPRVGGVLYPGVKLDQLGEVVAGSTVLGRVISPYTFEELEVIEAPFERSLMILLRGAITRVSPGDYAYMVANAEVD